MESSLDKKPPCILTDILNLLFFRQHEAGKRLWRKNKDRLKKEVEKLTKLLEKERKRSDKYRKKYKRSNKSESPRSKVQQLTKSGRLTPTIRKKLLYHEALIEDIKNKYKTARKEREKQLIAKVTVGGIVKRYQLQTFAEKLLGFSKKRRFLQGETISSTTRKPTSRLRPGLKAEVHSFYRRDDVSRITTGRKQTITRGKVKKQEVSNGYNEEPAQKICCRTGALHFLLPFL